MGVSRGRGADGAAARPDAARRRARAHGGDEGGRKKAVGPGGPTRQREREERVWARG
jgi:hypothetical protein